MALQSLSVSEPRACGLRSRSFPMSATSTSAVGSPSIGIVLPVLDEAAILERALAYLADVAADCPVVVVDGGSNDGSADIARCRFRTEVCAEPKRGAQMNLGARCLQTDVLLFLH